MAAQETLAKQRMMAGPAGPSVGHAVCGTLPIDTDGQLNRRVKVDDYLLEKEREGGREGEEEGEQTGESEPAWERETK